MCVFECVYAWCMCVCGFCVMFILTCKSSCVRVVCVCVSADGCLCFTCMWYMCEIVCVCGVCVFVWGMWVFTCECECVDVSVWKYVGVGVSE